MPPLTTILLATASPYLILGLAWLWARLTGQLN